MDSYLVVPSAPGPIPGVVVIHEIFGLNQNIREIADRFSGEGYIAMAVDLFSGANRVACMLRIIYGMLIRPFENGIIADLHSAIRYLRSQDGVDPSRIGVVGFCMGGSYALQLACTDQDLRAASVFYGMNPRPLEQVARACPIVGSYPEKDFTASAARKLEPMLERFGVPHDIKVYPDARHSFFNDRGRTFQAEAAADSWGRMMTFFHTHLGRHEP